MTSVHSSFPTSRMFARQRSSCHPLVAHCRAAHATRAFPILTTPYFSLSAGSLSLRIGSFHSRRTSVTNSASENEASCVPNMEVKTSIEDEASVRDVEVTACPMSKGSNASCSMRFRDAVMDEARTSPAPRGTGVIGDSSEDPIVITVVVTPRAMPNCILWMSDCWFNDSCIVPAYPDLSALFCSIKA